MAAIEPGEVAKWHCWLREAAGAPLDGNPRIYDDCLSEPGNPDFIFVILETMVLLVHGRRPRESFFRPEKFRFDVYTIGGTAMLRTEATRVPDTEAIQRVGR
jgi:hypothetical protein